MPETDEPDLSDYKLNAVDVAAASFLRGYFFNEKFPPEVETALKKVLNEYADALLEYAKEAHSASYWKQLAKERGREITKLQRELDGSMQSTKSRGLGDVNDKNVVDIDMSKNDEKLDTSGEHAQTLDTSESDEVEENTEQHPSAKRLTKDQKDSICKRYAAGESVPDLVVAFGCNINTIYYTLKKGNVKMRPKYMNQPKPVAASIEHTDPEPSARDDVTLNDSHWRDIKAWRNNDFPMARIAKSLGVDMDYLDRFIEQQEAKEKQQSGNW